MGGERMSPSLSYTHGDFLPPINAPIFKSLTLTDGLFIYLWLSSVMIL